jgi:predicted DNA-binding transcriptional regulator AlpA
MRLIRGPKLPQDKGITYSNVHRQRLENAGKFPKRVRGNPSDPRGHYFYIESEIDSWIAERAAEREAVA